MSLYNLIDTIAEREVAKTEAGDSRIFGGAVGIVAKKYSKDMPGRVCVQIPSRDKDGNILKWARIAMGAAGKGWGNYFVPEIGDHVLLLFEDGNIEKPYVVGSLLPDGSSFLSKAADENNKYKRITTKNGSTILFEDNPDGEGEKDKIQIFTAGEQRRVLMDNENKKIIIEDKEKKNSIKIESEQGKISVEAEKKMSIKVGSVTITIDGENGKVSVKCGKLTVKADNGISIETGGMAKVKASNMSISGDSSMKISSSGTTVIEGALIKEG